MVDVEIWVGDQFEHLGGIGSGEREDDEEMRK